MPKSRPSCPNRTSERSFALLFRHFSWAVLAGVLLASGLIETVTGQSHPSSAPDESHADSSHSTASDGTPEDPDPLAERSSTTTHEVTIEGDTIEYRATAGTMRLGEEFGEGKATVFSIAYERIDAEASKRPVTFTFNGGPGSSSVWLHLGAFGPRRVVMDEEGFPLPPPYRLTTNAASLLDVTDLVFIDPVSTGYSRAAPGEDLGQFHGIREDAEWVAEFIRLWTVRNERWRSPKFLAGESYGTTRAAALAGRLQEDHGLYLNGLILVSSILNFQTARFDVGNDLPYILFLPTYTAIAAYHGRLEPALADDLEGTLARAREFAAGPYNLALMQGSRLPEGERAEIAAELARLTGLSAEFVRRCRLRVGIWRFVKELLREEGKTVGRLDGRYTGYDRDSAGEGIEYDPSYAAIQGVYTACLNDYVRRELGYESDLPYEILSGRVRPWNYAPYENRYVDVSETLRQAMTRNPDLKVHVANGYYDLATPFFATEYTFDHLGLDASLRSNISMSYYASGHMMYVRDEDRHELARELREFVRSAVPSR